MSNNPQPEYGPTLVPPELAHQLAAGLEALRNMLSAFQSRLDTISVQLDQTRTNVHQVRNDANTATLQLALLNKDVERLGEGCQSLSQLVIFGGGGTAPLKERVTVLETRVDTTESWIDEQDTAREADLRDLIQSQRSNDSQRKGHYLTIAVAVVGWLLAMVSLAVAIWGGGKP